MRTLDGCTFLSATDLMRFAACARATTLDLAHMRVTGPDPGDDTEDAALLQKQGDAHEAAHIAHLKEAGRTVMEIERRKLGEKAEATRAALAAGADVVFEGAFLSGNWGGRSDFLERAERPSAIGSFSNNVADTKLKRRADPEHALQLVLYSDLLAEIQRAAPGSRMSNCASAPARRCAWQTILPIHGWRANGWKLSLPIHYRPA